MGTLGCGVSVAAFVLAFITALPFLGWGNWFTTIPISILAMVFSSIGLAKGEQRTIAVLGLVAGAIIFFWALFRLAIGGGLV